MMRFCRRLRDLYFARLQCLVSLSHLPGLVSRHLYYLTLDMMTQKTCPQFYSKGLLLRFSCCQTFIFICRKKNVFFFSDKKRLSEITKLILYGVYGKVCPDLRSPFSELPTTLPRGRWQYERVVVM